MQKFLEEAKYLEARSWLESRARVEGLVLDSRRSPSFAERGAGEVPESPLINCQLSEGRDTES